MKKPSPSQRWHPSPPRSRFLTADETYKEIEATIGKVPTPLKAYPKSASAEFRHRRR
jgi:hypothetical protein